MNSMLIQDDAPAIHDRVREHTAPAVNERIDRLSRAQVEDCASAGRDAIIARMRELDHEWDVDRALMANFALLGGAAFGTGLVRYATSRNPPRERGLWRFRRARPQRRAGFLGLFSAQLGFLMMHATAGWCPPLPLLRRLGFRTQREIERERRELLRALRTLPDATPPATL